MTRLIAFYHEMTVVDKWRAFISTLVRLLTVSHVIVVDKLLKYGLDKLTVTWTENCLNHWAQRVMVSSMKSSRRLLMVYSRDQYWILYCLMLLLIIWVMGHRYIVSKFPDDSKL